MLLNAAKQQGKALTVSEFIKANPTNTGSPLLSKQFPENKFTLLFKKQIEKRGETSVQGVYLNLIDTMQRLTYSQF